MFLRVKKVNKNNLTCLPSLDSESFSGDSYLSLAIFESMNFIHDDRQPVDFVQVILCRA